MRTVRLPSIGTARAWRDAARACLAAGLPPAEVQWTQGEAAPDLFTAADSRAAPPPPAGRAPGPPPPADPAAPGGAGTVPRSFLDLADSVVWHSDPQRFARLYDLLWRVRRQPGLMHDRADPDLARLRGMEKAVRRCAHRMTAFLRFREIGAPDAPRRSFGAWFEPAHHTLEPTAPFFAARFADMDWRIVTPRLTATFHADALSFGPGGARPPLPEDATEALWTEYFRSIFNPARLNAAAMRSEMPKRYWANMPEARAIPDLIASAPERARAMREAAPTLPPARAARLAARLPRPDPAPPPGTLEAVRAGMAACARCPLHHDATQAVPGEGPPDSDLMFVGEQPGDAEDLAGRPFVGPAGRVFDAACDAAGIDRRTVFVTNAVRHFKYAARGKARIHQRPNSGEVSACRWWLDAERALVRPRLIVALGATAAESLTGSGAGILSRRGRIERTEDGAPVFLTVHPSYLLRLPDRAAAAAETARFHDDLRAARAELETLRAA